VGIAPLAPADPEEIAGYRLYGRLGSGGQGVVYQGHSDAAGLVAVKALHATWLTDPGARARLGKEVSAARRVAPFCTARVLAADLEAATPYIVSEFIPGPSLAEHVRVEGPLSGTSLDRLAVGTMTALLAIHEAGLVHRDVKPANVILGPDGPRVVDFGIARDLNGHVSGTTGMIGTPMFMAPEQVDGQPLTPAADVFSWAVMMVHAATGSSPFEAEHVTAVLYRVLSAPVDLSAVPSRLAAVLDACLAKEPAARPTAQQVLLQLIGSPTAPRPGQSTWAYAAQADDTQALLARAATMVGAPTPPTVVGGAGVTGRPDPAPTSAPAGLPGAPATGGAAGGPTDVADRRPRRERRGRSAVVLAAVGVLALAAAVGLTVWDRTTRPSVAPVVVGTGPTVPATFAGTWTGGLSAGTQNWVTQVKLAQGATIGEQSVNDCRYVITLQEIAKDGGTLTFVAVPTAGPDADCGDPAWLTVVRPKPDPGKDPVPDAPLQVRLESVKDAKNSASGVVTHTG